MSLSPFASSSQWRWREACRQRAAVLVQAATQPPSKQAVPHDDARPSTSSASSAPAAHASNRPTRRRTQQTPSAPTPAPGPTPLKPPHAQQKQQPPVRTPPSARQPPQPQPLPQQQQQGLSQPEPLTTKDDDAAAETAFQEREVDVSVEDLLQLQYEVTEEELDQDIDEAMEEAGEEQGHRGRGPRGKGAAAEGAASETSGAATAAGEPPTPGSEAEQRRAAVLLELLSARGNLDAKLSELADYVDLEMLTLLERRIETARRRSAAATPGADTAAASAELQQAVDVYRALKNVYQRAQASPAMRLLDDVLDILGGDGDGGDGAAGAVAPAAAAGPSSDATSSGGDPFDALIRGGAAHAAAERRREAAARMHGAFTGGMSPGGVDIFAAAARLATSGPLAADELSVEYVRLHEFLAEAGDLLAGAREQQAELEKSMVRAQAEVEYVRRRDPQRAATDPAVAEAARQLQLAAQAHASRRRGIALLEEAIFIARAMETEPLREGGALGRRG